MDKSELEAQYEVTLSKDISISGLNVERKCHKCNTYREVAKVKKSFNKVELHYSCWECKTSWHIEASLKEGSRFNHIHWR